MQLFLVMAVAAQLVPGLPQQDPYSPTVNIKPDLTLKVTPKSDRFKPFDFTLSGLLQTNGVDPAVGCQGRIMVRIRKSNPTVAKGRTELQPDCTWTTVLTLNTRRLSEKAQVGGTVRVTARFGGNEFLQPDAAPQRKAEYGRSAAE